MKFDTQQRFFIFIGAYISQNATEDILSHGSGCLMLVSAPSTDEVLATEVHNLSNVHYLVLSTNI